MRPAIAVLSCLLLFPAAEAWGSSDLDLWAARSFAVGDRPFSVARADFNSDDIDDLAVANHDSDDISVLLGNGADGIGDGSFQPAVRYATSGRPRYILAADFDEDGIWDLAVTHNGSNVVSILLGNGAAGQGDGTFQAPVHYDVTGGPTWLAAGDFNADDILDLAAADLWGGLVSILIGCGADSVGDGTFEPAVHYAVGDGPNSLVTHDFDSDGILDLAVADMQGDAVILLKGNGSEGQGDGTFQISAVYPTRPGTACVIAEDFDEDGICDLAAANYFDDTISILIGDGSGGQGDGTFQPAVHYPAGNGPPQLAAGHFDEDGHLDLAVTNYMTDGASILFGGGDGTFGPPIEVPVGEGPEFVLVGDYNEDGRADLAAVNAWSDNALILLGTDPPDSLLFRTAAQLSGGFGPIDAIAADFNEDGLADLAVADSSFDRVRIQLASGDGTFLPAVRYPAGVSPVALVTADFDEDDILDLAVADYFGDCIHVLLGGGDGGAGDGTFGAAVPHPAGNGPRRLVAEDFDGDGILDVAAADVVGQSVSILLGQGEGGVGDGTFGAPTGYPAGGGAMDLAAADTDGDQILDLAVALSGTGGVALLIGNGSGGVGDGTFQPPVLYPSASGPTAIVTGLFDDDEAVDVAVACEAGDTVSVLLGYGDGTFEPAVGFPITRDPAAIAAADLNGDGLLDLATAHRTASTVSVLLGNGGPTGPPFLPAASYGVRKGAASIGAFRIDGDLLPDLVVADEAAGTVSILINTSAGGMASVDGTDPVSERAILPVAVWPNPLGSGTYIRFAVARGGRSVVSVFDVQGRLVRTLLDARLERGPQELWWDARDESGLSVPAGVYFCRVHGAAGARSGKIVVVR